jgi:ornithine--oxo-acid transaminase
MAKASFVQLIMCYLLLTKQTGSRTGRLLATCGNCSCTNGCENKPEVKADILILGKAISGGVYPVSAVLANNEIMNVINRTAWSLLWWKSSSGCCCCLEVVREENLSVNAERLGIVLRKGLNDIASRNSLKFSAR